MKKIHILFAVCLCAFATVAFGQDNGPANKLYNRFGFKTAIPEYEKMESLSDKEIARVANSYRLIHDTENAEIWYSQIVEQSTDPKDLLFYAQALQSNGKLDAAKEFYLRYDELVGEGADDRRGELLAQAIDRIREFKHSGIEIKNEKELNSESLDFSPTYLRDGIVFVSSRGVNTAFKKKDKWIDDNFMALFYAKKNNEGELESPTEFAHDLTTKFHEGPVAFSKSGNKIYFTRNHYNNGKRKNNKNGVMKQQIYSSAKQGDGWSSPVELAFNTKDYEEVHPALSPDGKRLYFSSDRPGGFGGMDLYVVEKRGVLWSAPKNLGENINTPGNEVFPFMHDDGTLYFASNGWEGLGGLDIYSSRKAEDDVWLKPQNEGTPFNSSKDDFGFIMNPLGTEGYFTSARDGGQGQDDIYSFQKGKKLVNLNKKTIRVCAFKQGSDSRIAGAQVTVRAMNENGKISSSEDEDFIMRLVETGNTDEYLLKLKKDLNHYEGLTTPTYTTNEKGEFLMEIKPGATYQFEAKKNGFVLALEEMTFSTDNLLEEFCIPMSSSNCLSLAGKTLNEKYLDKAIPGASVTLINLCTGEETYVTSDLKGNFNFPCLECDCDFVLKGEKTNFSPGISQASSLGEDCSEGGEITANLLLSPADINDILFVNNKSNAPEYVYENGKVIVNNKPKSAKELSSGDILELRNIYYDFDRYYIREDAKDDLEQVITLMESYPTLIIELGSHTDSRASHSYNMTLSQNRAEAAVDYIVKRGISERRIVAKGYGETKLRNKCRNGVECTEEEHQNNRRTEVKILEHYEGKLNINYIDNAPETIDPAPLNRRKDRDYKNKKYNE